MIEVSKVRAGRYVTLDKRYVFQHHNSHNRKDEYWDIVDQERPTNPIVWIDDRWRFYSLREARQMLEDYLLNRFAKGPKL